MSNGSIYKNMSTEALKMLEKHHMSKTIELLEKTAHGDYTSISRLMHHNRELLTAITYELKNRTEEPVRTF